MTIQRVRTAPGGTDQYGDPMPSTETRTTLEDSFVAPRVSSEVTDAGRAGVIVGLTLFMPPGTDLVHSDQVDVDGVLYEVDGDAGDWTHPMTGWAAGVVAALRRVDG